MQQLAEHLASRSPVMRTRAGQTGFHEALLSAVGRCFFTARSKNYTNILCDLLIQYKPLFIQMMLSLCVFHHQCVQNVHY